MINISIETMIVQVMHFLILVYILNRLMFRPILKVIRERTEYVEKRNKDIGNLENEAIRLREECLSREIGARKEAAQERSEIREAGILKVEEFTGESRKQVEAIKAKADKETQSELERLRPMLSDEAATLVDDIVERMIGRRIAN